MSLRDVLARQNRAEVEQSSPRPHYRVAQEEPPRGSVTPVEEPGRELRGPVMERLDMRAFQEMRPPEYGMLGVDNDGVVVMNLMFIYGLYIGIGYGIGNPPGRFFKGVNLGVFMAHNAVIVVGTYRKIFVWIIEGLELGSEKPQIMKS
ncbi:hypothetical protein ACLOJK_004378 [Asimina triloba]